MICPIPTLIAFFLAISLNINHHLHIGVLGHVMGVGKHSWLAEGALESYAARAGFTQDQIADMKARDVSLFIAATKETRQLKRKTSGGAVVVGTEPILLFIEMQIGTPLQTFRLNLDTGSSTLAIPHRSCSGCGTHCNNPYSYSNTTTVISCSSVTCCGSVTCPATACAPSPQSNACGFKVDYVDQSHISGAFVIDTVKISNFSKFDMVVGSILSQSADFEPFEVDGIIGVSLAKINSDNSGMTFSTVVDELTDKFGIPKVFSLCFGLNGGSMMFGGVDVQHMTTQPVYTPFNVDTGFYQVTVNHVIVADQTVASTHYAIVDSGTTLWYVPMAVLTRLTNALKAHCGSICSEVSSMIDGYCYSISDAALSLLPSILIQLSGGGELYVGPDSYLRTGLCSNADHRTFSIAAADQAADDCGSLDNPCLYGDVFMLPYTWVFDQEQSRIGFAPRVGCDDSEGVSVCPNTPTPTPSTHAPSSSSSLSFAFAIVVAVLGAFVQLFCF